MILDDIIAAVQRDLKYRKQATPVVELECAISQQRRPLNMASALRKDRVTVIAEIKQASPSRGLICRNFDPEKIARIYSQNGASAISILTEMAHFKGDIDYLKKVSAIPDISIPLLRKDFIFDPYQVYESRANGADALLLIAAILMPGQLRDLQSMARGMGMQCLVEIHNKNELDIALQCGPDIIGINNRDLNTFQVDLETTMKLRPMIPKDIVVVSESGIKGRADIVRMEQYDIDAVLVGESLMASGDIAAVMRELA